MCSKIVLVAVNSTVYDMDCNEAKMNEGLLQVKNCIKKIFFSKN